METKDIINGLVALNKWRRDNDDETPMPDPKRIGILIDSAAERLGKLEGEVEFWQNQEGLAERDACVADTELEQAKARVAELEAKVNGHLGRMGFVWK